MLGSERTMVPSVSGVRRPETTVFALGVEHEIDHRLGEAGRWIPRKRHAGARRKAAIAEHHGLNRDRGALEIIEFLQTPIGLRPLAHPGAIDRPCGGFELRRRILQPAVVAILDQRLLVGGEAFQRFAVELAVAQDVFACRQLGQARGEGCRVEPEHGLRVTFQEAPAAIPGEPWPAGQPDQALRGERCAADIEHGIQHARHRSRSPRADRYQQRLPVIAEAFSGDAFQEFDALFQPVAQMPFGMRVLADDVSAELDREHEGRRHRQTERRHPRQVRGLVADGVGGMLFGRYAADTNDMHGLNP